MNIVKKPQNFAENTYSIGLTGVTKLIKGNYSTRHIGKASKYITDEGTINIATTVKKKKETLLQKKKRKPYQQHFSFKSDTTDTSHQDGKKEKKAYHIKKSVIKNRIYGFINANRANPILHFITISFPPCVTDATGYQLLNTWLTVCRKKNYIKNYLWVAERQKIGTIHYHLAIPAYINVQAVNRTMITCITSLIRKNQIIWSLQSAKRYNGIDIAKDRITRRVTNFATKKNGKSLAGYLTKYVTKNTTAFERLAWHNSRGFGLIITKISCCKRELAYLNIKSLLDLSNPIISEHINFYRWKSKPPPQIRDYLSQLNILILKATKAL